ncbi:MAG TPA: hypothetical protein VMS77_10225 [Conexivisphaerales archaeon]|nr:hypothetical protein [Conexivisphaerales archaeon]
MVELAEAEELRRQVALLRRKLIRQRVFHKALTPIERGIVYLTSRPGLKMTSELLQGVLKAIISRASLWLQPSFVSRALVAGCKRALANVRTALLMGNKAALSWSDDRQYLILLGIHSLDSGPP